MRNRLKELRALNAFAKKQSVGMQRKLMLYWVSMILVVFAAVILLLSIAGAFSRDDEQLHEVMELHLSNTSAAARPSSPRGRSRGCWYRRAFRCRRSTMIRSGC